MGRHMAMTPHLLWWFQGEMTPLSCDGLNVMVTPLPYDGPSGREPLAVQMD